MSGPRPKRQFAGASADPSQRHITSFFSHSSQPQHSNPPKAIPESAPHLPQAVQSNLLSVGMRVRKSVPEGYKTGDKYGGGMGLFNSSTVPSSGTPTPVDSLPKSIATNTNPSGKGIARELTPFCGINKIGGLDMSPSSSTYNYEGMDYEDDDQDVPTLFDIPALSSSQTTLPSSSQDAPANARKRFYVEDDDGDETTPVVMDRNNTWIMDGEISPRSFAPAVDWGKTTTPIAFHGTANPSGRLLAAPRRRTAAGAKGTGERAGGKPKIDNGNSDFPEAEFLDYRDMEMD